jgi:hypothetical protein
MSSSQDQLINLPEHVRYAIQMSKLRAKHSPFYYRMKDLNSKIYVYKHLFNKVPGF